MNARDETAELTRRGYSPAEIARKRGVSIGTTLQYLDQLVGEGRLRKSDILHNIPSDRREHPSNRNDELVVSKYGHSAPLLGEIYEDLHFIETTLHNRLRTALILHYGVNEDEWWQKGIPEPIRKKCHNRREEDAIRVEPYCYTDLVDLKEIIDKQWSTISKALPRTFLSDKAKLLGDLDRLNRIRRVVMHPVRGSVPSEEDFDFLRAARRAIEAIADS